MRPPTSLPRILPNIPSGRNVSPLNLGNFKLLSSTRSTPIVLLLLPTNALSTSYLPDYKIPPLPLSHLSNRPYRPLHSTSSSVNSKKCWKCHQPLTPTTPNLSHLICPHCGSLQISDRGSVGVTYYELLNHPCTYLVDVERLSLEVKRLQKKFHPDLFAGKGKKEQGRSEELSSYINKAFSTLSDPIERGRYLLRLKGLQDPLEEVERRVTNDPAFLEEVMELNERLEELEGEEDWKEFKRDNEIMLGKLQQEIAKAFEEERIEDASFILGRMKFFDTLQGKLKELKGKLGIVE